MGQKVLGSRGVAPVGFPHLPPGDGGAGGGGEGRRQQGLWPAETRSALELHFRSTADLGRGPPKPTGSTAANQTRPPHPVGWMHLPISMARTLPARGPPLSTSPSPKAGSAPSPSKHEVGISFTATQKGQRGACEKTASEGGRRENDGASRDGGFCTQGTSPSLHTGRCRPHFRTAT